jgi:hypothetical protein
VAVAELVWYGKKTVAYKTNIRFLGDISGKQKVSTSQHHKKSKLYNMKKIGIILPVLFFALYTNAQILEDDPSVGGKSTIFGKYRGIDNKNTKPIKGQVIIKGIILNVSWCEEDCLTILVKTSEGSTLTVGTKDYGFSVPKGSAGKKIIVEGIETAALAINRKTVKKEYQKEVQIAATGIKIYE